MMAMDVPPAIHYEVAGEAGEAVVLLNGGMMSSFAWQPIAHPLSARYQVVRLDFRGQLRSPETRPEPPPPPDLAAHAADVVAVLDRLEIRRAHVVGTSYGALVGLVLAAEHPERVASLTAMTATARMNLEMDTGTRYLRQLARETVAGGDGGKVLDAIVGVTYSPEWLAANQNVLAVRRAQVAALPKIWFAGLDRLLAAIEGLDLRARLGKIQAPTVVVAAEKDVTFPLPFAEELAAAIPGARLRRVPEAHHGFVLEKPELALAVIEEALASFAPPAPAATPAPEAAQP